MWASCRHVLRNAALWPTERRLHASDSAPFTTLIRGHIDPCKRYLASCCWLSFPRSWVVHDAFNGKIVLQSALSPDQLAVTVILVTAVAIISGCNRTWIVKKGVVRLRRLRRRGFGSLA